MHFDKEFIKTLKTGNKKNFERLFLTTYESLCEYSVSITGSVEVSEGAVQDIFSAIWHSKESLDEDINIRAYLFRSVKNRSLDLVQHHNIRVKYRNEVKEMYTDNLLSDNNLTHESKLIQKVRQEVENLPQKNKEVYLLHRRDGLTYAEISKVLGISVKAVEARMTKALKFLRERLSDEKDLNLLPLLAIFGI